MRNPECGVVHTLNVFHQNFAGAWAGVRLANVIDSDDPEAVALQLTETGHSEFSGGMKGVWVIHPNPIGFALILNLNDVAFNGASSIPLWRFPGQGDTVLCLISNLRSSRHTWRSWSKEDKCVL